MPKMNITKFLIFVILGALSLLGMTSCAGGMLGRSGVPTDDTKSFEDPQRSGKLESGELKEASGIAASKCQTDVYWTHNDSGDGAFIYAVDSKGKNLGVWKVTGATNVDWEDIASTKDAEGKCSLFIGDIGNNQRERTDLKIYRIDEPQIGSNSKNLTQTSALETAAAQAMSFSYPDTGHNAEALIVVPNASKAYIVTKRKDGPSQIYKLNLTFGADEQKAVSVGEISVPAVPNGSITGGDISASGDRIVLCDYFAGYELQLPPNAKDPDEIWNQKPQRFDIGDHEIGEAVAYTTDGSVIAISENKYTPVYITNRKNATSR